MKRHKFKRSRALRYVSTFTLALSSFLNDVLDELEIISKFLLPTGNCPNALTLWFYLPYATSCSNQLRNL